MTKKSVAVLLMLVLMAGMLGGCACSSKSVSSDTTDSSSQTTGANDTATTGGIKPMTAETAAEKAALTAAAKPEGRKWAAGNPNGTASAEGDPFLVGYSVYLTDGKDQYAVWVFNGSVVPFVGTTMYVKSANDGNNTAVPASTKNQEAAVAAAQASLKSVAPNAKPGGIGLYIVFFPKVSNAAGGYYPMVATFAQSQYGVYAQGGTQYR